MKIFQKLNYGFGGCDIETCKELRLSEGEYYREDDIKYIDKIELGSLNEIGRKFLLNKRALKLLDGTSIVIPKGEITMSLYLGKLSKLYFTYLESDKESDLKTFNDKLYILRIEIAKRLFSKRFSEKYRFKFKGISGVALSHSRNIDEVLVPAWSGLEIGSLIMATRDPVQNIVVCLRVTGYTDNEIRVSPNLIEMIGGDFDGDKIQVMDIKNLYIINKNYFQCSYKVFEKECEKLSPSNFFYKELLAD